MPRNGRRMVSTFGQDFLFVRRAGEMRRNQQRSITPSGMSESRLQGSRNHISKAGYGRLMLNRSSQRAVLPIDRSKSASDDSMDERLRSALSAQDQECARILHEVDGISKTLKSGTQDLQTLSHALRCAVSCVAKQIVLDKELRSLALTDDLTGLHNRRSFVALATQQLKVTRRKGQELLLCFADVDNLKDINDSYGHKEGDLALVRTARALERTFRDSDILARIGGDEFAVLALEASGQHQQPILRRFERSLMDLNADEPRYKLSVSIGVARLNPRRDVSLGELMQQADQAMYTQKERAFDCR